MLLCVGLSSGCCLCTDLRVFHVIERLDAGVLGCQECEIVFEVHHGEVHLGLALFCDRKTREDDVALSCIKCGTRLDALELRGNHVKFNVKAFRELL